MSVNAESKSFPLEIEANSLRLQKMTAGTQEVTRLATGFSFTEGPVWHPDGYLLFSDIPNDKIWKWVPGEGCSVFIEPSGHSNGLAFDPFGQLTACEHGNRQVTLHKRDGSRFTLASHFRQKRLNSPNDLVYSSCGDLYFTDPTFGVQPEERELDFCGVYQLRANGDLNLLVDDFQSPNGLAFSPDGERLYIADSFPKHVRVFELTRLGRLKNGGLFADMSSKDEGLPDGLKVDEQGIVYVTGPGGLWIFDPDGGLLGRIRLPEIPANCAWGPPGSKTLYLTARTSIYRIQFS